MLASAGTFPYRRASPFMVIPGGVNGLLNPHNGDMQ
jgi:hypothetical protein